MNIRKLGALRTSVTILFGFALMVAGLWIVIAHLFGAVVGAGTGAFASGLVVLVLQGLSEEPRP